MEEILISVSKVSKKFCKDRYWLMRHGMADIFRNIFLPKQSCVKLREKEFFALQDVSFCLNRGECLGILGPNGAGKTTLLKLVSGVLIPDKGEVSNNGKIAGIIDSHSGLSAALTGKENIYFCCSLYGKKKAEIEEIFNDIVVIAGIGDFINAPVRTYSLGMLVRLIFAITVSIKSDILLFDDALFVGDFEFKVMCKDVINKLKKNTAIIFASHSADTLFEISDKIMVIDKGNIRFIGDKSQAVNYYYEMFDDKLDKGIPEFSVPVSIYEVSLRNKGRALMNRCNYEEPIEAFFKIRSKRAINSYLILCAISTNENIPVIKFENKNGFGIIEANVEKSIKVSINNIKLVTGKYYIGFKIYDLEKQEVLYFTRREVAFIISGGPIGICPVNIDCKWDML